MNQLTTEVKLSNLNKAKRKLEEANELIFDAGTLVDDSALIQTKKFFQLRIEVQRELGYIEVTAKDLRMAESQAVKMDATKPHIFEEDNGIGLDARCIFCKKLASDEIHVTPQESNGI